MAGIGASPSLPGARIEDADFSGARLHAPNFEGAKITDGWFYGADISGNLPDIASDALVISRGRLALATDQGVFTAIAGKGGSTRWSRLGFGLPNAAVDDLTAGPDGYVYAATHGRGVWRIRF